MPSTITHAYMAADIYNKLEKKIKLKFKDKIDLYQTFSQGGDIFFFNSLNPTIKSFKLRNFSRVIHDSKVNELFISLVSYIKKTKNFDQFIFLAGLLTHYVGDYTCHPFIDFQKKVVYKSKKNMHFKIEAYIDNYILNSKGINYKKYKLYKLLNSKKNENVIDLINNCFYEVFKEKNMGLYYYNCLFNMKLLYYLIRYDPFKIKYNTYSFLYHLIPFLKYDIRYFSYNFKLDDYISNKYLNLEHNNWYNPRKSSIKSNKSFLDLYDDVVNKSKEMIEALYQYIYCDSKLDLNNFFGNLSYSTGLPLKSNK